MIKLTKEEYLERIRTKQSISRFEFELDFEWNEVREEFIKIIANLRYANLRYANLSSANLSSADLRSADLSFADLRSADLRSADLRFAKGEFIFNFGVKLKVV